MNELPHLFGSPHRDFASRREFLRRAGAGCGTVALTALLHQQGLLHAAEAVTGAATGAGEAASAAGLQSLNPLAARPGNFPAKAKSVIWLFKNGGPSQVDTWDYKPELEKRDGKELEGFDKNTGFFTGAVGPLMNSPF